MDGIESASILRIRGGHPIRGIVQVPGSKNAALAVLSAVLLASGKIFLTNVPNVSDIHIKLRLLEKFGAEFSWEGDSLTIDCSNVREAIVSEDLVRPIRTSFYILGPLLARLKKAQLPAPGGCKIGARPVDLHVKGLEMLGAQITLDGGIYFASVRSLVGTEIYLDYPSAGATQHIMATACLADGCTTIQNAAMEPEIVALASLLNAMGGRVEGAGSSTITITGVKELQGCEFRIPEDRLQASTYLLAAAISHGEVEVRGIMPEHQTALLNKLKEAGIGSTENNESVQLQAVGRPQGIKIKTMPYPGFPTDVQQPMAAVLALGEGTSHIEETIYESRIGHVQELNRMGAKITVQGGRTSIIEGVEMLRGATVEASDLRAGAALVLAGLAAQGETVVKNVHFIDRGYENFEENLRALGADIERQPLAD